MNQTYPGTQYVSELRAAEQFLRKMGVPTPDVAIVLGSGLGSFVDELTDKITISYGDIPHFPVSSVPGHAGQLVIGKIAGRVVAAMQGRVHQYEGFSGARVAFGVRTLMLLGAKNLLVTNAAGAVNPAFKPGDLVLLSNIITFFSDNPSTGVHHPDLGQLFYDISTPFDRALSEVAQGSYGKLGIPFRQGVYLMTRGPAYETAADIKAAGILGADLVGMSTVPEVLAARQMGVATLGISLVTNMAAGVSKTPLNHEEVVAEGKNAAEKFKKLVGLIIQSAP